MTTVSNWKKDWKKNGDDAKPSSMSKLVWDGMVKYWLDPHSIVIAGNCSTSR